MEDTEFSASLLKMGGGGGGEKEGKKEGKKEKGIKLYASLSSARFNLARQSELMVRKLTALLISTPRKEGTGQRNLSSWVSTRCFFKKPV